MRKVSEILPLQQELAQTIAEKLRVKLSREQQQTFAKQGTTNPEAYGLYVRGLHSVDEASGQGLREAIELFRSAIEKDGSAPWAAWLHASRSGVQQRYGRIKTCN